jgi:hypothetical protein
MKRVALMGTTNGSKWRDSFIPKLSIEYFNPVVEDWNNEAQANELKERDRCDYVLYVITPFSNGWYSIAEAVDDSNKRPEKTLFVFLHGDGCFNFTKGQVQSLQNVAKMVKANGGKHFLTLDDALTFLNTSV